MRFFNIAAAKKGQAQGSRSGASPDATREVEPDTN